LKSTKKEIKLLESHFLKNLDLGIESNDLKKFESYHEPAENSATNSGIKLVEISELIEDAKKLEKQKFCFLWWCW